MGFNELFALNESDTHKYTTVLLDGGLGTTLEDVFHKDLAHPLWSARLVDEDEGTIVAAHLAFLRAGSQLILTSTYQAAYETFRRANYTDLDAERLMRKSVNLASEACRRFEQETYADVNSPMYSHPRRTYIALSLGPYGATLPYAAEFTGKYPPPYGPAFSSAPGALRVPVSVSEEQSYEDALAAFHFSRLLVYARESSTWDALDIVAFETVPLVTEAKAIRRAVSRLDDWFRESTQGTDNQGQTREMKPWYISFVFPGPRGEFPQHRYVDDSSKEPQDLVSASRASNDRRRYTPSEVFEAAFSQKNDGHTKMAIPDAIGVNCTKVPAAFQTMDEFIATAKDSVFISSKCLGGKLPWLALLPNGGLAYDIKERTWINEDPDPQADPITPSSEWALSVGAKLRNLDHSPPWAGVFGGLLVGGCCKVGPDEIQALRQVLSK